jgi:IS30 family transposase
MKYQQLTKGRRYQISALLEQNFSVADIAKAIGCHRSNVYRELKRNKKAGSAYCPEYAEQQLDARRKASAKYGIPQDTVEMVEWLLGFQWSPEQISAISSIIKKSVSHEWIYRHIERDKACGGKLYRELRQGHRRYRKGRNTKREPIIGAVSIDERPAIVDGRSRVGDWEIDTVLGKNGTGAIVTIAERKTRFYLAKKVSNKSAEEVTKATIAMLSPYKAFVHTITADNGKEFMNHADIGKALKADVYFAHPYSSWERGLNENFNGLLRQYIPKGTDLREVTDEEVLLAQMRINSRPRKCLGFRQPQVLFTELLEAA